jgi:hypothetical protein
MWVTEVLPDGVDTAYTSKALKAHTDGCYLDDQPGIQVGQARWPCFGCRVDTWADFVLRSRFSFLEIIPVKLAEVFASIAERFLACLLSKAWRCLLSVWRGVLNRIVSVFT